MNNKNYFSYESLIGRITIASDEDKVVSTNLGDYKILGFNNVRSKFLDEVFYKLSEYLKGIRKSFDIPVFLDGSEFQNKVWSIISSIPYGEVVSYYDIAKSMGNYKLSRAVGGASGKNKILILIPCHRVIGKNGKLCGYSAGISVKEYLIGLESKNKFR